MRGWRLLIVAVSAMAALAVGLGAQARPSADEDLHKLLSVEIGG